MKGFESVREREKSDKEESCMCVWVTDSQKAGLKGGRQNPIVDRFRLVSGKQRKLRGVCLRSVTTLFTVQIVSPVFATGGLFSCVCHISFLFY